MMAFIQAISGFSREHMDAVLSLVGIGIVLVFIEVRLRALFARHEVKEEKMHASAVLLADTAAATAREAGRHIDELRLEANALRLDISNVSELVRSHEVRLAEVEMRILRASIAVPRRPPEEP
jgi:hypothetical protein